MCFFKYENIWYPNKCKSEVLQWNKMPSLTTPLGMTSFGWCRHTSNFSTKEKQQFTEVKLSHPSSTSELAPCAAFSVHDALPQTELENCGLFISAKLEDDTVSLRGLCRTAWDFHKLPRHKAAPCNDSINLKCAEMQIPPKKKKKSLLGDVVAIMLHRAQKMTC